MTVDASIPTGATLGSQLWQLVQENREEINLLWAATVATMFPSMNNIAMPNLATTIDVEGTIISNITMAAPPNNLTLPVNGYDGQLIILRINETEPGVLTVVHNVLQIYLQDTVNFAMRAGDTLWLINIGGVIGTIAGVWYEINRSLYGAVLGLIAPGGGRKRITVTDLNALQVTNL